MDVESWRNGAARAVGEYLRARREALALSQQQVADAAKRLPWRLTRAAISAIERGRNLPGMEALLVLHAVLGVDPGLILELARTGRRSDRESGYLETAEALWREGAPALSAGWARAAIASPASGAETRTRAWSLLARISLERGEAAEAHRAARRAVELSGRATESARAGAWLALGLALLEHGDPVEAGRAVRRARQTYRECRDLGGVAEATGVYGRCLARSGRPGPGRAWMLRAARIARRSGSPPGEANWLVRASRSALKAGDGAAAERYASAAARIARRIPDNLLLFRARWLVYRTSGTQLPRSAGPAGMPSLCRLYARIDGDRCAPEVGEFERRLLW